MGEVAVQPLFVLAVLGGVIGQGTMVYVMTATPVSMHIMGPHDLEATASVIRAHIIAMYLPSLVSGQLITLFGHRRMMTVGTFILLSVVVVGLMGQHYMHYWFALVLLGFGWNFLFVGGTMNLVWIGGLTIIVLIEKLIPKGHRIAQGLGVILVLMGVFLLLEPVLSIQS